MNQKMLRITTALLQQFLTPREKNFFHNMFSVFAKRMRNT
ncbi:hypothetical protein MCECM63_01589 [Methylophilaceae bacterium]